MWGCKRGNLTRKFSPRVLVSTSSYPIVLYTPEWVFREREEANTKSASSRWCSSDKERVWSRPHTRRLWSLNQFENVAPQTEGQLRLIFPNSIFLPARTLLDNSFRTPKTHTSAVVVSIPRRRFHQISDQILVCFCTNKNKKRRQRKWVKSWLRRQYKHWSPGTVCLRRQVCNSKSTQNLAAFRLAPSHWLLWDFCWDSPTCQSGEKCLVFTK